MPSHEEHCKHSFERYGVRGDEIHTWIDEPSRIYGASHRKVRHGIDDLDIAVRTFGAKYGGDMVRNIYLDHQFLDSKEKFDDIPLQISYPEDSPEEIEARRKRLRDNELKQERFGKPNNGTLRLLIGIQKFWINFFIFAFIVGAILFIAVVLAFIIGLL